VSDLQRALRRLQQVDHAARLPVEARTWLIEAETLLGDQLGLECTGEPGGWNADGDVVAWDHNGGTCPVHEWLDASDYEEADAVLEGGRAS
jgi:hypothetical protein